MGYGWQTFDARRDIEERREKRAAEALTNAPAEVIPRLSLASEVTSLLVRHSCVRPLSCWEVGKSRVCSLQRALWQLP
jgi:hypothetical protein